MSAPDQLQQLIDRFERNRDAYRSGQYNETQVRRDFIDPFLRLLGWDVDNAKGYAEQYREVVHEDAVKVSGSTKAPDYSLRIGGQRKLFVEAKKPSVNIKQDVAPAFQVRRYAWSAKLPLSILTDFEEFAVYDCRDKPDKKDAASHARIMYLTYLDYAEKWDELVELFSPDAIMQGAFDKFVQSSKKKRGTAEVDDAFLAEISTWREQLARNIALRNPGIKTRDLNHAVQRTIDRLIFLRIAEDRGIEQYGRLREATNQPNIYAELGRLFQLADAKYNSGLFHFKQEKGWDEPPDTFTLGLNIDDKVLRDIIKRLYYPDSPYQFDVIPADILGQVYEQFLGKVIRLTPKGQAKIEDKPEVKKAGGVFYTPTYIVDYIVQQTVGQLLEGKKPGPKGDASKLRILDPACGSGSFLLGAYQYLLDWHLNQYLANNPDKWARGKEPPLYQNDRGDWRLTIGERKRILLNNIYGVDIDPQAVEVTKLSLLLKVMEGETEQTLGTQLRLLPERVLPDLSANIQCGNSLIGPDFYDGQQLSLGILDEEEMYRINVFDWDKAFPRIVPWGGFDAIIGNPPYIRIQSMKEFAPKEVEFYKKAYQSASKGNYDIYVVFLEKGLGLLHRNGLLGFILPHKFFQSQFGEPIRNHISNVASIQELVHFGAEQVFENATTYTCLLFLTKQPQKNFRYISIRNLAQPDELMSTIAQNLPSDNYNSALQATPNKEAEWHFFANNEDKVLEKLQEQPKTLADITRKIFVGLQTSSDKVFVLNFVKQTDDITTCYSAALNQEVQIETKLLKPFLKGKDVHRYQPPNVENVVLFPYEVKNGRAELFTEEFFSENFPLGWKYLSTNKEILAQREKGRFKKTWWQFGRTQNLFEFETRKIMTPEIALGCQMSIDELGQLYHTTKIYSFVFNESREESIYYFLGVLNSKLLWFFLTSTGYVLRGGYFTFKTRYLEGFPIPVKETIGSNFLQFHDKIVELVRMTLSLNTSLAAAQTAHEKTILQRQITATDHQIDQLVYQLYNLTPEEIAIVEGAT